MSDDDFFSAMSDVKPLKQDTVRLRKKSDLSADMAKLRRDKAEKEAEKDAGLTRKTIDNLLAPHDIVGYKSPGVQDGVYKKLRLGRYEIDGRLDLHRHTLEQASAALAQFIQECLRYELRCVLVMPGKGGRGSNVDLEGNHIAEGKSVLKSYTAFWLEEIDEVIAYHSAQPFHGGAGAFYVLLKKSESAKQRNRERHGLR